MGSTFQGINFVAGERPVGTTGAVVTFFKLVFSFGVGELPEVTGGNSVLLDVSTSTEADFPVTWGLRAVPAIPGGTHEGECFATLFKAIVFLYSFGEATARGAGTAVFLGGLFYVTNGSPREHAGVPVDTGRGTRTVVEVVPLFMLFGFGLSVACEMSHLGFWSEYVCCGFLTFSLLLFCGRVGLGRKKVGGIGGRLRQAQYLWATRSLNLFQFIGSIFTPNNKVCFSCRL